MSSNHNIYSETDPKTLLENDKQQFNDNFKNFAKDLVINQRTTNDLFALIQHYGEAAQNRPDKTKPITNLEDFKKQFYCMNNKQEFKNNIVIKNIDPADLMKLINAYIGMNPKPKDFNEFVDKANNQPGIMEFIKQILDKLFICSTKATIGQHMNKILEDTKGTEGIRR